MKNIPDPLKILIVLAALALAVVAFRFADGIVASTQDTSSMATYQVA